MASLQEFGQVLLCEKEKMHKNNMGTTVTLQTLLFLQAEMPWKHTHSTFLTHIVNLKWPMWWWLNRTVTSHFFLSWRFHWKGLKTVPSRISATNAIRYSVLYSLTRPCLSWFFFGTWIQTHPWTKKIKRSELMVLFQMSWIMTGHKLFHPVFLKRHNWFFEVVF